MLRISTHARHAVALLVGLGLPAVAPGCGGTTANVATDGAPHDGNVTTIDGRLPPDAPAAIDAPARIIDAPAGPDAAAGTCLGQTVLGAVGKTHLLVGGTMEDATASSTPIELRYVYLSGGLFDGSTPCASCASGCTAGGTSCANGGPGCAWWGCWQYDQDPPGQYPAGFVTTARTATPAQVPMITYYEILQTSHAAEGAGEVQATTNVALMTRYYADWRFLLQTIGQNAVFLHIEPDFWGYAEQLNDDPHAIPSAVETANPTDCGSIENTIAGMGTCMIAMVRKYAPNARVGLHASGWATKIDVLYNTDPNLDVAGEAKKVATFLGACGETGGDFIVVEASDRDAGWYATQGRDTFWDPTNATLPNFHQDFAWAKALTEALGKPALWWQIPLGNMSLPNMTSEWQDNRVDYYFAHMDEVAGAHGIGVAYGAGATGQTTPETDGGNFIAKVKAYAAAGGQAVCP